VNVREAMVSDPRVVEAGAPVTEAAELLTHPNVRSVLVVDGDRLVGCVTPTSVVAAIAAGTDLRTATAADVAEGDVPVVGPDQPVDQALRLMGEHDLERIGVVEEGRFLGVLPRGPVLRRLAEDEPGAPEEAGPGAGQPGTGRGTRADEAEGTPAG
jgi:CBS domain-containing protein